MEVNRACWLWGHSSNQHNCVRKPKRQERVRKLTIQKAWLSWIWDHSSGTHSTEFDCVNNLYYKQSFWLGGYENQWGFPISVYYKMGWKGPKGNNRETKLESLFTLCERVQIFIYLFILEWCHQQHSPYQQTWWTGLLWHHKWRKTPDIFLQCCTQSLWHSSMYVALRWWHERVSSSSFLFPAI